MLTKEPLYFFSNNHAWHFSQFYSKKSIICNDKDSPRFLNQIEILTVKKNYLFKNYTTNCRLDGGEARLQNAGIELIHLLRS